MTKRAFEPTTDKPNDGSLTVICEPDHFPCSYDAFWLIVNAMALARVHNYPVLKFWFRGFDENTTARLGLGNPAFIRSVVKDLLDMFNLSVVEDCTGHWVDKVPYNMSAAVNIFRKWNAIPPRLYPREESVRWAQQFKEAVTITLRQTRHYHKYNSLLYDWIDIADCLRKGGHRVIFVPDTRYPEFPVLDYEINSRAAVNTHDRLALYSVASQNFFVANGPCTLCKCTPDIPYVQFVTKAAIETMEVEHTNFEFFDLSGLPPSPESSGVYRHWLGFDVGEQCPWADLSIQRHVWKDDTFNNIIELMDEMYPGSCKGFQLVEPVKAEVA